VETLAPIFAIGDGFNASRLFLLDDLSDAVVLIIAKITVGDFVRFPFFTFFQKRFWA